MDPKQLLAVYRAMVTARRIDKLELELNNRGEAFFHVSGAGHEGTAILASLLHDEDWLLCHYRDKALMIARGVTPRTFFDGLFCKQASPTRGRQMCAHAFADRELKILSAPVPGGQRRSAIGRRGHRDQGSQFSAADAPFDRRRRHAGRRIPGSLCRSGPAAAARAVSDPGQPSGDLDDDEGPDVLFAAGR